MSEEPAPLIAIICMMIGMLVVYVLVPIGLLAGVVYMIGGG